MTQVLAVPGDGQTGERKTPQLSGQYIVVPLNWLLDLERQEALGL